MVHARDGTAQTERIESSIYLIRKEKVMLDHDLASLYGVPTKAFVQAVKRNPERFPPDFMFQLSDEEFTNLGRSAIPAVRLYRAGCRYALERPAKSPCHSGQCRDHACVCSSASPVALPGGTWAEATGAREQVPPPVQGRVRRDTQHHGAKRAAEESTNRIPAG